jgi:hypothetical protein
MKQLVSLGYLLGVIILVCGAGGNAAHAQTDVQIESIEVNQAIGVQLNNALKFVAGKDTVVRAILSQEVTIDPTRTSALVSRDGTDVALLEPAASTVPSRIIDFPCPSRAACGDWQAGSYVFKVLVNGVEKTTEGTDYTFVPRKGLRVLVVPVKANYNGTITTPGERWKTMDAYLRRVYPIAADNLVWDAREELDASDPMYNLETDEGRLALWKALVQLQPTECQADLSTPGCYDKVLGFVSDRANGYPTGTLQGYTYGPPGNIIVESDEDAEATVAHEIGHNYGLGDTYNGGQFNCDVNPTPNSFQGRDFTNPGASQEPFSCLKDKLQYEGVSAPLVAVDSHPYEVGGRGALPQMASFMGSGGKQEVFWPMPEEYDRLFEQLAP